MGDGNTLAGAEKGGAAEYRRPHDLLDEFDAWWPEAGYDDRSEALRALMREATGRTHPMAARRRSTRPAYQALRPNANPDTGKIGVDAAKAAVTEATRVQKEAVRDRISSRWRNAVRSLRTGRSLALHSEQSLAE